MIHACQTVCKSSFLNNPGTVPGFFPTGFGSVDQGLLGANVRGSHRSGADESQPEYFSQRVTDGVGNGRISKGSMSRGSHRYGYFPVFFGGLFWSSVRMRGRDSVFQETGVESRCPAMPEVPVH